MKFVLSIDYKAKTNKGLDYFTMDAKNELEAIAEADKQWCDDVYMMQIMKQEGKQNRENGWKVTKYTAVLARRSYGWHLNNIENCEAEHSVEHYIPKNPEYAWFATL